ncbi:MAG: adenylate/guanylate cyclase domain-containing protein [Desulfobulbaceae bacterium]|nr:adenylate/guanylate cyclase domain-containing protein [Desulfobulbaceae bacterium]
MTGKILLRRQILATALCTLVVIGATILAYRQGFLATADNFFYDLSISWRGPVAASGQVTLVLMDEESAVRLQRQRGQWSRRMLAGALDNLCSAGAEVIGLDMVMSAPDQDKEADRILAQAIARCNNVVLARVSAAQGVEDIAPLAPFQAAMIGDGFIDVPLDSDGVLRKIRFLNAKPQPDGGLALLPSFALELARSYHNIDFNFDFSAADYFLMGSPGGKQLRLPYPDLLINYYGDYTAFATVSFADAVHNTFAPEKVRGKVLLVGSTLSSQKDFFTTPFSRFRREAPSLAGRFGDMEKGVQGSDEPGVACHAHAIETILNQSFISPLGGRTVLLLTLLLGLAGLIFYLPRLGMLWEVFILLATLAAIVGTSHLAFLKWSQRLDIAPLLAVFFLQFLAGVTLQKSIGRKKTAMITSMFGKYVSAGVVNELIKGDISTTLEGRRANLTMLFSDLRGFTNLSEKLGARDTGLLLNAYFDTMIPQVFAHQGTLDKLMGDAVMAFFGAPLPVADHPAAGAATALEMVEKLAELKKRPDIPGLADLTIGIGLNTGEVTVGNLGSKAFMDYTIIGDAVNLASRLEGLNKIYGTTILLSEFTAEALDDRFLLRDLDIVRVKGKDRAVSIYELAGWRQRASAETLAGLSLFTAGLTAYRAQQWDTAENLFHQAQAQLPGDGPSRLYLERIVRLRSHPPGPDWQGITTFDHK